MDLLNDTLLRARLFTGFTGPADAVGSLVARMTWRLADQGELRPAEDPWPVLTEPLWTEVGEFPSDSVPEYAGCDVVITGVARAEAPVASLLVTATVGAFSARLEVLGDRVWQERDGELVPSDPRPFTEMPLVWERAYGGAADHEGAEARHPLNQVGTGFHLKREQAVGRPLPNLERPDERIRRWDDRPLPACWAPVKDPLGWHLAPIVREAASAPDEEARATILAGAHERVALSAAQPGMIAPEVREGDEVAITGVAPDVLRFRIPALDPRVHVDTGAVTFEATLPVSGLWVLLSQRLVIVTYRVAFRYPYVRRRHRAAALVLGAGRAAGSLGR
ncbi:uncharacterized protein SOCE26_029660 [Sorangium cellulosum]|uniref:DUF2169 domain-containing protein n=1 Tax=Sorangium cellulosum TaxID=56 RepID=A0A2L0EQH5_SORCE|nr:DUF2169 domain-containing protein [Sorangium cellulosum]AUX41546.1 uncharacterized protein SOCE26_029660 [Sorangium cellulosum]